MPPSRRLAAVLLGLALLAGPASAAPLAGRPVADDVFYQIMPIAWRDSNGDPSRFGDFGGMTASLPYLKSLGITAVWMTPIFDSPAYHGYQHLPPNLVNPRLGTESEFWTFVDAAHADSIKVFIDFVAYTVSQNSTYFQSSIQQPASPYTDYLAYLDPHVGNSSFVGGSYTTWDGGTVGDIRWNLANPVVTELIDGWTEHWMDPNGDGDPADGIDGWRLDHVVPDEGWGYTMGWWSQWKAGILAKNPDAFTMAEQADWGYGAFVHSAHDAAFTIPFQFAARNAITSGSAAGLYSSMASTLASVPPGHTNLAILGNHDVDRLASALGNNAARDKVAAAVLLLQPFPPCIYYGDELGMRGTKANWGTDANDIPMREPFKWNAVAGPPMSNYFVLNANAYNARFEQDNDGRSVPEQSGGTGGSTLLATYRSLISLRREHEALRRGGYAAVPASSGAVWAFVREAPGETLLVAINLASTSQSPALDLSAFVLPAGTSAVRDVQSGATLAAITPANQAAYPLTISPRSYRVLRVGVASPPPPPPSPYDGRRIPTDLGPTALLATQTTATTLGDDFGELDQLFVRPEEGGLAVGLTGNLPPIGFGLGLFLDTGPGGQDSLNTAGFPALPSGPQYLTGLGMDTGFAPDVMLWVNLFGGVQYVDLFTLAPGGGGTHRYLGSSNVNSGRPELEGGSNPNGMRAAYADSNRAGVTGSSAGGAATATFGLEAWIPWADLGLSGPGSDLRVLAALIGADGAVSNQTLPPLGPGQPAPGSPPFTFKAIPGQQYAVLSAAAGAPAASAPAPLRIAPAPFHRSTRVAFTLARAGDVDLDVLDLSGRRVRRLQHGPRTAGAHAVDWDGRDDAGRTLPAGVYFVRLRTPDATRTTRVARLR